MAHVIEVFQSIQVRTTPIFGKLLHSICITLTLIPPVPGRSWSICFLKRFTLESCNFALRNAFGPHPNTKQPRFWIFAFGLPFRPDSVRVGSFEKLVGTMMEVRNPGFTRISRVFESSFVWICTILFVLRSSPAKKVGSSYHKFGF